MPEDVIPPLNVNPPQDANQRGPGWRNMLPNGPAAQELPNQPPGQAQQLRAIASAMTDDEKKDYTFVT